MARHYKDEKQKGHGCRGGCRRSTPWHGSWESVGPLVKVSPHRLTLQTRRWRVLGASAVAAYERVPCSLGAESWGLRCNVRRVAHAHVVTCYGLLCTTNRSSLHHSYSLWFGLLELEVVETLEAGDAAILRPRLLIRLHQPCTGTI
jgi:hypothetical protein